MDGVRRLGLALCLVAFLFDNCYGTSISYNWVSYTLVGEPCLGTCGDDGLCYIDHHLNVEPCRRDILAGVPNYRTAKYRYSIDTCVSNCGKFGGYSYNWCYVTSNYYWDYCNPEVASPRNTKGRTLYGNTCIDQCKNDGSYYARMRCRSDDGTYTECAPQADVPVQSCENIFTHPPWTIILPNGNRGKRSPLDEIFSATECSETCRTRYRNGRDGEVEQMIASTTAPGRHPNPVTVTTNFPPGSPYSYVATTTLVNTRGDTVLLPLAMRATLRAPRAAIRTSQDIPSAARTNVHNMYNGNWAGIEVSHLVGFANGGTRDMFNFIGTTSATNKGPFKVIENFIRYWMLTDDGYVEMTLVIDYSGTAPREIGVKVKFFNQDGSLHSDCLDVFVLNI